MSTYKYRAYNRRGAPLTPEFTGVLANVDLTGVSTTSGSNEITVASTTGLMPGMGLAINTIPRGSFIQAIKSATVIVAFAPSFDTSTGAWTVSAANANATATASSMLGKALGFNPVAIPEAQPPGDTYRNRVSGSSTALYKPGANSGGTLVQTAMPTISGGIIAKAGDVTTSYDNAGLVKATASSGYQIANDDAAAAVPPRSRTVWTGFYYLCHADGCVSKIPAGPDTTVVRTGVD